MTRAVTLAPMLVAACLPAPAWAGRAWALEWQPNPAHELVLVYRIYDADQPAAPVAEVDGAETLYLLDDLDPTLPVVRCWLLTAVSAWGESLPAGPVCTGGGPGQAAGVSIVELR